MNPAVESPRPRSRRAWVLAAALALAPVRAQELQVALRASAPNDPPAITWLVERCLPARPEWPAGLAPGAALRLRLDAAGLHIVPGDLALPQGTLAVATFAPEGGPTALARLAEDGVEDWYLPTGLRLPGAWLGLLHDLSADVLDAPRSLDAAALAGHLAGATVDGDPRRELAGLAARCGGVTYTAWRTDEHLRVRGRSDGGLLLPALAAVLLAADRQDRLDPRALRAFAACDGDRDEAARQLVRSTAGRSTEALRALLHGEDELRVAAIDSLVRRGAAEELPRIVAAASPAMPFATTAVRDAVPALWSMASAEAKQRTRGALARSLVPELRGLAVDAAPPALGSEPGADPRARWLLLLLLAGIGLYGLWLRERTACRAEPATAP